MAQGELTAEQERRRLASAAAPIADLAGLLELQGVRTAVIELPADISGLTLVDSEAGRVVSASGVKRPARVLRST